MSFVKISVCVLFVFLSFLPASETLTGTTYSVDRLTDASSNGGGVGAGLAGDLRYCITNAQSGSTIIFRVTGTINLARGLPLLNKSIKIAGPGTNLLIVHGAGGSAGSGVFAVASGTTIALSGLTVTGGVGNGAGIFNGGILTLNNVAISGNRAGDPTNGGGTGAGIWNYVNATLTLNNSTVNGNTAVGNLSYSPSRGGGIANYGTLVLNNSTVSGNAASQGFGGGINNIGTLTLNNSTISGNSAWSGGGLINHTGSMRLTNVTLSNNSALDGGAVFNVNNPGVLTYLKNTLIAASPTGGNCQGKAFNSSTSSLSSDHTCALSGTGDRNGIDPLLTPLGFYGGSTLVHMLKVGSPALDGVKGSDAPEIDQRGMPRPQGRGYDIGAIERQPGDSGVVLPPRIHLPLILK